ncbi:MAG: hypothetical protein Q6L54_10935, partial [Gloeomargarita sp. HHBFW_bins_205]
MHLPHNHDYHALGMPEDPIDLAEDLLKMGLYSPEAVALGERLTKAEMLDALFTDYVAGNDP